jgi:hypothetical protein
VIIEEHLHLVLVCERYQAVHIREEGGVDLVFEHGRRGLQILPPASVERHYPESKIVVNESLDLGGLLAEAEQRGQEEAKGVGVGGNVVRLNRGEGV